MMKVELVRARERRAYCDGDIIRIVEDVRGVCVKFSDNAGRTVSLAFDGRVECEDNVEYYGLYRDCPVMTVNRSGGPMNDRQAIVALRDALNGLDLGE